MNRLKEVYNPLSDTHLVLYRDAEKNRYGVARRVRSLESGRFGLEWFEHKEDAVYSFEQRLVKEAGKSLLCLVWSAKFHYAFSLASFSPLEPSRVLSSEYDAQRFMLYDTEKKGIRKVHREKILDWEKIKDLCAEISEQYKIIPPSLSYHPNGSFMDRHFADIDRAASYNPYSHDIAYFGANSRTRMITCHETAHAVISQHKCKTTAHGPYFARVLTQIYCSHLGQDPEKMVNRFNKRELYGPKQLSVDEVMSPILQQP